MRHNPVLSNKEGVGALSIKNVDESLAAAASSSQSTKIRTKNSPRGRCIRSSCFREHENVVNHHY